MDRILCDGSHIRLIDRDGWEFAQRRNVTGIVVVVPITNDDEVVFVEQYRPPVESNVIELCAGLAGDIPGEEDEDMTEAARRELLEECGYAAGTLEPVTEGPPAQGICDEYLNFYVARDLQKIDEGGGDESEDIIVHHVPAGEVCQWLESQRAAGKLVDPKVYAGLFFVPEVRPGGSKQ